MDKRGGRDKETKIESFSDRIYVFVRDAFLLK